MRLQYRLCVLCIYRTLIQQKLLVEFTCELLTLNSILRDLLSCMVICHCDKQLLQQLWNGEFHTVSLYSSMKHLISDIKNIKESLQRMSFYIKAKSISANPNNVKNLESISKELQQFLSVVYELHQDSLHMNDTKTLFRNKVKSKFNLQVSKTLANNKGKKMVKPTYVSSLPLPILAKMPKEVNKISKYFKKVDMLQKKSYTQVSSKSQSFSFLNATMNTLKIKEMFPKLQNKKIDQVQRSSMEMIANLSLTST